MWYSFYSATKFDIMYDIDKLLTDKMLLKFLSICNFESQIDKVWNILQNLLKMQ